MKINVHVDFELLLVRFTLRRSRSIMVPCTVNIGSKVGGEEVMAVFRDDTCGCPFLV